jgi:hypothetical protein
MDHYTYVSLVAKAIDAIEKLRMQREAIEAEIMKQEQFIAATANFLPKEERELIVDRLKTIHVLHRVRQSGLTSAVRVVLSSTEAWMTAAQVRDRLISRGFDFSSYSSNPLASVATTLKRMKFEEVETGTTKDGVITYRWKDDEELAKAMAVKQALDDRKKMALSERIVTNQRPKSIHGPIGAILREEVKK